MYSYTNFQDPILLTIRCDCGRQFSQQEIYTCLGCSKYACRYCTSVELHSYYCRNCSTVASDNQSSKFTHCQSCFSCPTCSNTLSIYKDPKLKKSVYLCQFCYWTSKEIGIAEETAEQLTSTLSKATKVLKQGELKYYQHCQRFLKDKMAQNGEVRVGTNRNPRTAHDTMDRVMQFRNQYLGMNPSQTGSTLIANTVPLLDEAIKFTGLYDQQQENDDNKIQKYMPKQIPLVARKTRRCNHCNKLLTKSFKTFRNQHKVQLGHNQPKVLMCQKTAITGQKVKVRAQLQCKYKPNPQQTIQLKQKDVFEVPLDKFENKYGIQKAYQFIIERQIAIPNKQVRIVEYRFILQII